MQSYEKEWIYMLKITEVRNLRDVYGFQLSENVPYFFDVDFESWKKSFTDDIDGEGRTLFISA